MLNPWAKLHPVITALLLISIALPFIACSTVDKEPGVDGNTSVRLAVAADFAGAAQRLADDFTTRTGIPVTMQSGASGELAARIRSGAAFDVFLSANTEFPRQLIEERLAAPGPIIYALGTIALFDRHRDLSMDGETVLSSGAFRRLAVADPSKAPYGLASFETLGWMIASAVKSCECTADDVMLPGSSLSHIGALAITLTGLGTGARVLVARSFDGDELLPLLRKHRPTVVVMLPAALICLVRDHGAKRQDFAMLRLCISGGDKVSAEIEREFTELVGFPIDEGYGMTEIGFATINQPSGLNKIGSIGNLNPGYALSIRSEDGAKLSSGGEGRLWIKTPCSMAGYWANPAATEETLRDGWLDTGDIAAVDADGYLWFRGRKKQVIVHDGSNICPQEVEGALLEHPTVASAGVVGLRHRLHGETVRAYITLKESAAQPTSQALIRFVRDRSAAYKAPEEIVVLEEMPLNATGKVDRVTFKRMAEQRPAARSIGGGIRPRAPKPHDQAVLVAHELAAARHGHSAGAGFRLSVGGPD